MNKIIVTGANGFVGKNLLNQIPEAIAFERSVHDFFQVETLKSLLVGADAIIHLAGVNAGTAAQPSSESLIQNNLEITRQLIKAISLYCKTKPRVVFLSSIHVYDSAVDNVTESTLIAPKTVYGVIKYSQELLLKVAADLGIIDLVIFRASNIYGPEAKPYYNSGVTTMCFNALQNMEVELYGSGYACLDLIYIADVITIIKKTLEIPVLVGTEIYNLASGTMRTVSEVVSTIEQILNHKVKRKLVESDVRKYSIDNIKLRKRFGEIPITTLQDGLREQIKMLILNGHYNEESPYLMTFKSSSVKS